MRQTADGPLAVLAPRVGVAVFGTGIVWFNGALLDSGPGAGALVTTVTSMVGISLGIRLGLTLAGSDPEHPWAETRASPGRSSRR